MKAHENPILISDSDLCIPRNETARPHYFQNRIIMFSPPISTFLYLWGIYIFPGLVCLVCCSQIGRPILGIDKSLTDTWCRNLKWDRTVSFLGKHKSDFRSKRLLIFMKTSLHHLSIDTTFSQIHLTRQYPLILCYTRGWEFLSNIGGSLQHTILQFLIYKVKPSNRYRECFPKMRFGFRYFFTRCIRLFNIYNKRHRL
jgi:hypothetical protein